MGKYIRYSGSFLSRASVVWRVDILIESDKVPTEIGELTFPADEAVTIQWDSRDKEEVISSSSATVKVISPSDRAYEGLYTTRAGSVRMNLYCGGNLYWSGTLDPEFYEEPYERADGYEVSLTFEDFGLWDRTDFTLTGRRSIADILNQALAISAIEPSVLDFYTYTSLWFADGKKASAGQIIVNCANFYDEDGEAKSWKEVVEGILQPLGWKIVQRAGKVYVYDLNGLHESGTAKEIYWSSDSQTLGVDKTVRSVTVTFSPYDDTTILDCSLDYDDTLKNYVWDGSMYMVDNDWDDPVDGFELKRGIESNDLIELGDGAAFYKMTSEYSGSNDVGVVWAVRGSMKGDYNDIYGAGDFPKVMTNGNVHTDTLFKAMIFGELNCPTETQRSEYRLKVSLETLFDVRYNPFESAAEKNEEGNYSRLENWVNFGYVPVRILLYDENDGDVLYHYENNAVMLSNGYKRDSLTTGWVKGDGEWGDCWLAYYDIDNRKSKTGFGGWQTNRQCIGYYRDELPRLYQKWGTGEFIELPPVSGRITIEVGRGIHQFDYNRETKDIYSLARWLMYRNPKIELVKANGNDIDREDIVFSGWIDRDAEDELSLNTICGTDAKANPTARGCYIRSSTGEQIVKLVRNNIEDRPERLLIGTLYSQYSERRVLLSGEARFDGYGPVIWTDRNQGDRVFMEKSASVDVIQDTMDVEIVEFVADEYVAIEEV